MKTRILTSKVIHTDDTPVTVLDRTVKRGSRTGRFWVYVGDNGNPYDVHDYTPNRTRDGPVTFLGVTTGENPALGEFTGYLHADAYGGYDRLYAGDRITELACWAHARRKFAEAESTEPIAAKDALDQIGVLYGVERDAKESRRRNDDDDARSDRDRRSTDCTPG